MSNDEEYDDVVDDFQEEVGENDITDEEEPAQEEPDDEDEVTNDVKTPTKRKRPTRVCFSVYI